MASAKYLLYVKMVHHGSEAADFHIEICQLQNSQAELRVCMLTSGRWLMGTQINI